MRSDWRGSGAVGEIHREARAFLDAGGRIADDVVEAVFGQLLQHALDAFLVERFLVARLRGREHVQRVEAFVLDQRLLERALLMDHVDEVVDDAPLATHDQVEVAQADVEVDHCDFLAASGQADRQRGAGRGLAHAALAGCDDDDLSQ